MNKVKDLVSVNVECALRLYGTRDERYELISYIGEFLKHVATVTNVGDWDENFSLIEPPERFAAFLQSVNGNFVLGAQSLLSLRFDSANLNERALAVITERAEGVERSIPTAPPVAAFGSRAWEPDHFLVDVIVYLWMEFFVRFSMGSADALPRQLSLIGQGG